MMNPQDLPNDPQSIAAMLTGGAPPASPMAPMAATQMEMTNPAERSPLAGSPQLPPDIMQLLALAQGQPMAPEKPPTKREIIGNALGDFLVAMGQGLANRGKGGQSTGAGAAMMTPTLMARQRATDALAKRQMEFQQHHQTVQQRLQEVEALIASRREGREQQSSDLQGQNILSEIQKRNQPAAPLPGRDVPLPPEVEAQQQRLRAPTSDATNTMTPQNVTLDGKPALVLRNNKGDFFDIATKKPITGRIMPYVAPPTPRQKGEITPTAEAGLIQSLNRQWETAAKDVQAIYRANTIMNAGMDAARKGDMNAGSQAVLVTFQKFLDPQSVVRESEYARSGQGLSMANRIRGYVDRLEQGGAGVTLPELEAFAKLAQEINQRLSKEGDSLLSAERRRISSVANRYDIPIETVIPRYNYANPGGSGGSETRVTMPDGTVNIYGADKKLIRTEPK